MDRPDIATCCRQLAKGTQAPTTAHWTALKRLARYLLRYPRLLQWFPYHGAVTELIAWSDADHAGCVRTRKSTSGGVFQLGAHTLHYTDYYTRGQGIIALSSGEAEYYAVVSAISTGLGLVSMAKDYDIHLQLKVMMDASAAITISHRRGLGRLKACGIPYSYGCKRLS